MTATRPTWRFVMVRLLWATALLLPGALAFQPTFGGIRGVLPGLAGVLVGVGIGGVSARRRWTVLPTVLSVIAAYFLLGGPVALRATTSASGLPTVETLRSLSALIVQSWRDLLTVSTPAGDFTGPMVMPWLAGLVIGCITASIMTRSERPLLALLGPGLWLVLGIAFGVRDAPGAVAVGVLLAVVATAWLVWAQLTSTRETNDEFLANPRSQSGPLLRRAALASVVIVIASSLGYVAVAATSERANRQVLRDYVAPPLNLADYPTPLAKFRLYQTDLKDEVLMTVDGLPDNTRLRLATMDTYDGTVYNVSRVTADYVRIGKQIGGQPAEGEPAQVDVQIGVYDDVWLPLAGTTHRAQFDSDDARRQGDGLYFNRATDTALTTARLGAGDVLRLAVSARPEPSSEDDQDRTSLGASQMAVPQATGVPDVLGGFASDAMTGKGSAFEQMAALEAALQEGYFSDGSDGLSRSGHTNERLTSMFSAEMLIGDDEQYATAMALMANQLGVPTRLVLGFDPGDERVPGSPWDVHGSDARVWVESHFDQAGWIRFEPTPDRDRTPQTQVPRPKPQPRPMVEPPPNPPEQPPVEPDLATDGVDEEDGDEDNLRIGYILLVVTASVLILLALLSPFIFIVVAKARRRRTRRSHAMVRARFAGGWDEILDAARDFGEPQSSSLTRKESARGLREVFTEAPLEGLADLMDTGTFAPGMPAEESADDAWARVEEAVSAMSAAVPWHRRLRAQISLRSLRYRRHLARTEHRHARHARPDATAPGRGLPRLPRKVST